MTYEISIILQW